MEITDEQLAALVEAKSHTAFYAKTLISLRHTLISVSQALEDEGDRVYLGSTNDADRLKDISGRIDDLAWEEILADSHPPLNLYDAIERGNAERAALEATILALAARVKADGEVIAGLWEEVARLEGALSTVRQSLEEQAAARRDPTMPILVPSVREALKGDAKVQWACAEDAKDRINAHGLMLLCEWQERAALASPPVSGEPDQ